MITLTQTNINALEHITHGKFGHIYQDGTYAYKIYIPKIHTEYGTVNNPCLSSSKRKVHRIISRAKQVRYTDLNYEEIYLDRRFGGVRYKYLEGTTLSRIYIGLPYLIKRDISLKLIRNNAELLSNNIYPLDYKLNNIICSEDYEPHIIDLDDVLTKVTLLPSRRYHNEAMFGLKQTIMTFFNDANINLLSTRQREMLDSYQTYNPLYQKYKTPSSDISEYLVSKEEEREYLFIPIEEALAHIFMIKKFQDEKGTKLVLLINKYDYTQEEKQYEILKELKNMGIRIYDILTLNLDYTIPAYTECSNTKGYYTFDKTLQYTKKV
jgi:hypothetical protein